MDAVLLDTDVFSYLIKEGDTRALLYRRHVAGKTIALSFITVGELYVWTVKRRWNAKRVAELERRIRAAVIVPYDLDICRLYGKLKAELITNGRTIPSNDLWIAVCAMRHSLPLVTHNRKDFEGIPSLRIISESEVVALPKPASLFEQETEPTS